MIYVCSLKIDNNDLIEGKDVITTVADLYKVVWDRNTKEIEFRKDFLDEFFTPDGLNSFITQIEKLNPYLRINIAGNHRDRYEDMTKELQEMKSPEAVINYFLRNQKETLGLIQDLADNKLSTRQESLKANNKLNTLHLELSSVRKEMEGLQKKGEYKDALYNETRQRLEVLVSRINYNYSKNANVDKLLGTDVEFFNYNRILYIKEITRVHYVDTLIYYLQEILKTLYSMPARLVVIESAYAYKKAELYPTCKKHTDLIYRDIIDSDIYMAGYHSDLMDRILKNPSSARFLIVLDRSGFDEPYLRGESVEHVITVSDHKDLKGIVVDPKRVISYSNSTLHIPFIKGFDELSMGERINKYSSMESLKELIDILEKGTR